MKISELVERLNESIASHGDCDVGLYDTEYGTFTTLDIVEVRQAVHGGFTLDRDSESLSDTFVGLS